MPPKKKKAAAPAVLAYVTQGKTEHMASIVDPTNVLPTDGSGLSKLKQDLEILIKWGSTGDEEYVLVSSIRLLIDDESKSGSGGRGRRGGRRGSQRAAAAAAAATLSNTASIAEEAELIVNDDETNISAGGNNNHVDGGSVPASAVTMTLSEMEKVAPIGTRITRRFDKLGPPFKGTVTLLDLELGFFIEFDDGDKEDMNLDEIQQSMDGNIGGPFERDVDGDNNNTTVDDDDNDHDHDIEIDYGPPPTIGDDDRGDERRPSDDVNNYVRNKSAAGIRSCRDNDVIDKGNQNPAARREGDGMNAVGNNNNGGDKSSSSDNDNSEDDSDEKSVVVTAEQAFLKTKDYFAKEERKYNKEKKENAKLTLVNETLEEETKRQKQAYDHLIQENHLKLIAKLTLQKGFHEKELKKQQQNDHDNLELEFTKLRLVNENLEEETKRQKQAYDHLIQENHLKLIAKLTLQKGFHEKELKKQQVEQDNLKKQNKQLNSEVELQKGTIDGLNMDLIPQQGNGMNCFFR